MKIEYKCVLEVSIQLTIVQYLQKLTVNLVWIDGNVKKSVRNLTNWIK